MRPAIAALLLLVPAQGDDAPVIVPQVDAAVRAIAGYTQAKELRPVADDVFLRRVMKDLVDAAPTDAELQAFVGSTDAHKRPKKINELLADERYGKFWAQRYAALFFGDVNRLRFTELSDLPAGREAVFVADFVKTLGAWLNKDRPWSEIANQMLTGRGGTEGDSSLVYLLSMRRGKGFQREFAENVSRHFLGIRLACARCHDHPYDVWTCEQYYGMAAFIARQRAKVVGDQVEVRYANTGELRFDAGGLPVGSSFREGSEAPPKFLFGQKPEPIDNRMDCFARFLTDRATTQFPRALANRTWGWLFGAGIVQPVDDFSLKNKAISPALLELLTKTVVDNGYSLKHLLRVICNTQAYQMPTPAEAPEAESFRHAAARKAVPRAYAKLGSKPPALPVAFDVREEWLRVMPRAPAKALFLIPHPEAAGKVAELTLVEGKIDPSDPERGAGKIEPKKSTQQPLKGKDGTKIVLTEITGTNWCQQIEGPVDYRLWLAAVESPKPVYFRVGGPADLLDPCRADFITLLQSLSLK